MHDVFISYKRDDRAIAQAVADALDQRGLSLWWDQRLVAGVDADFEKTVRTELALARCVIVLWTTLSVESVWVKAEAEYARLHGTVLPVVVDGAEPPLPFNVLEGVALGMAHRSAGLRAAGIAALVAKVETTLQIVPRAVVRQVAERVSLPPTNARHQLASRRLDVAADAPDRRDRPFFQAHVAALPAEFPAPQVLRDLVLKSVAQVVLDQGAQSGGAAFGLVSVINYHHLRSQGFPKSMRGLMANAARLFTLACLQAGPSADSRGVSCRSTLAGWLKQDSSDALLAQSSLAGYYRVPTRSIYDIQNALCLFGALYASAVVHTGWLPVASEVKANSRSCHVPAIAWRPGCEDLGGHAMALIGYNPEGFLIINSWGPRFGRQGVALLGYADWLANGMDVWATTLATPVNLGRPQAQPRAKPRLQQGAVLRRR